MWRTNHNEVTPAFFRVRNRNFRRSTQRHDGSPPDLGSLRPPAVPAGTPLRITTLQTNPNLLNRKLFYPRTFTPLLEASRGRGFRNDEVLVGLAAGFEFHFVLVQGELDGGVELQEQSVKDLQESVEVSLTRYRGGTTNYLAVLDSQRSLFDAELTLAQARNNEY
jgi:hypothetical protein